MWRTLLIIVLFFGCFCLQAQEIRSKVDLNSFYPEELSVIADSNETMCFYYKNHNLSYKFRIVDKQFNAIKSFSYRNEGARPTDELVMRGAIVTDSAYIFYFNSPRKKSCLNIQYISKTGNNDRKVIDVNLKRNEGDEVIDVFSNGKILYVLIFNGSLGKVNVLEFTGLHYTIHSFNSRGGIGSILKNKHSIINDYNKTTINQVAERGKVYITEPAKIILTEEKEPPEYGTKFWILDLRTGQLIYDYISGDLSNSNTFYFENKLYRLGFSKTSLKLELIDIETKKLLHNYYYSDEDTIMLISDKIHQVAKRNIFSSNRKLEDPKKIFKQLNNGIPIITLQNQIGDTLLFGIGSYQLVPNDIPGGMVGTSIGAMPSPFFYMPSGNSGSIRYLDTWFNAAIKESDYSIVSSYPAKLSEVNLVEEQLKRKGVKQNKSLKFWFDSTYYYGYTIDNSTWLEIIQMN